MIDEHIDVAIVGSGPAGMSTALHLLEAESAWADRIVILDKAIHPRHKPCGGGITGTGERILKRLGLPLEPHHVSVGEARFVFGALSWSLLGDPGFRIVHRAEFDHWLVQRGRARGLKVREGEAVKDVRLTDSYAEIITTRSRIRAKVIVAADGAKSSVRRILRWPEAAPLACLLEALRPEALEHDAFRDRFAQFDFSPRSEGLQGYYWEFPSLVSGEPVMNRGVFNLRARPSHRPAPLKQLLEASLEQRGEILADHRIDGSTLRPFDKQARLSDQRLLLAGDAAGADPLLGEGIAFALAYGEVAAEAIVDGFERQNFSFANYRSSVLDHPFLGTLPTRTKVARLANWLDCPWKWRLGFGLLSLTLGMRDLYRRFAPQTRGEVDAAGRFS